MHLSIKLAFATLMWTVAFALALFRTLDNDPTYTVWAILCGLMATTVSMWLAIDLVAERIAKGMVERLVASDEQSAERVASKITVALREGNVKSLR